MTDLVVDTVDQGGAYPQPGVPDVPTTEGEQRGQRLGVEVARAGEVREFRVGGSR